MAITDKAAFEAMIAAPDQRITITTKTIPTIVQGRWTSLWTSQPFAGAAPTSPVAPTRATTGAIGQRNGGANPLRLISLEASLSAPAVNSQFGTVVLYDRLSAQGGLSATVVGAQTTNLPTAALTRYTSGEGVEIWLEIYTLIGATARTITATYTNQAGVGSRVTQPMIFGGTGFREAQRATLLPLQDGDTGVRSVQSVNAVATTGTAGAFGITLAKPLAMIALGPQDQDTYDFLRGNLGGGIPEIADDACLAWQITGANGTTAGLTFEARFAEDR